MSQTFLQGGLAEKARIATTLLAEILAELPYEMLKPHQEGLQAGVQALQLIHRELRSQDKG